MSQQNKTKISVWLKIAIAILTAILGAVGESTTNIMSNLLNI